MSSGWNSKSFNNFNHCQSEKDSVTSGQQCLNTSNNEGSNQTQSQGARGFSCEANGQQSQNKSHINWDHIVEDEFRKEIGKFADEVNKNTNGNK